MDVRQNADQWYDALANDLAYRIRVKFYLLVYIGCSECSSSGVPLDRREAGV